MRPEENHDLQIVACCASRAHRPGPVLCSEGRFGDYPHPPDKSLSPTTRFLVPPPDPGSLQQVIDLFRDPQVHDAALIAKMVTTPQAVWITKGTPAQARRRCATRLHVPTANMRSPCSLPTTSPAAMRQPLGRWRHDRG